MANPKDWPLFTETDCADDPRLDDELLEAMAAGAYTVGVGWRPAVVMPAGYDEETVAQVAAGEEDQSAAGWDGA